MGNYEFAIKAASVSPTLAERAKTLVFVARCAADKKLFDLADKAASKIPTLNIRDSARIEIINARSRALSGSTPAPRDAVSSKCAD